MKKIYMAPLTEVVKINAEMLICASPDGYTKEVAGIENAKSGSFALDKDDDYDDDFGDLW